MKIDNFYQKSDIPRKDEQLPGVVPVLFFNFQKTKKAQNLFDSACWAETTILGCRFFLEFENGSTLSLQYAFFLHFKLSMFTYKSYKFLENNCNTFFFIFVEVPHPSHCDTAESAPHIVYIIFHTYLHS